MTLKSEIAWRVDGNGMLLGPAVHDGQLVRLGIAEGILELCVRRLSGSLVTLELAGRQEFAIRELLNGAIVSELWVWKVGAVPEASWAAPDGPWNSLLSGRMRPDDARREAARLAAARPDALLIQLACSYGGGLVAVCDHIGVFES